MKASHVVCDTNENVMRCNHCGETQSMEMLAGQRLGFAVGIMQAFVRDHAKCKPVDGSKA